VFGFRENAYLMLILSAAIMIMMLSGCSDEAPGGQEEVFVVDTDLLRPGQYDVTSLVDSMVFISLAQFDDERVVGSVNKVVERDHKLFLLDRTGNRVWVYDRLDNRLTIIGHQGTAPGEFVEATDLVVNTDAPELFVIGNRDWGVIRYNFDGRFISEHRLERAPVQAGYLQGALCIQSGLEPPYDVYCYDTETWKEKSHLFPLPEDITPMSITFSGKLKNCGSRLYYNYPTSSLIYEISSLQKSRPVIQVTGEGFWPEDQRLDLQAFLAEGQRLNLSHLVTYEITPGVSLFYCLLKNHIEGFVWFPESGHLYSKKNLQPHPLASLINYPPAVGCTDDGGFFFVLSPEWKEQVISNEQVGKVVPHYLSQELWDAIDEENKPILAKIWFKDIAKDK